MLVLFFLHVDYTNALSPASVLWLRTWLSLPIFLPVIHSFFIGLILRLSLFLYFCIFSTECLSVDFTQMCDVLWWQKLWLVNVGFMVTDKLTLSIWCCTKFLSLEGQREYQRWPLIRGEFRTVRENLQYLWTNSLPSILIYLVIRN